MLSGVLLLGGCAQLDRLLVQGEGRKAESVAGDGASRAPQARADVREAQKALSDLGYKPGPVDGMMGKRTEAAIRAFQKDEGLQADGRITPALLEMLAARTRNLPSHAHDPQVAEQTEPPVVTFADPALPPLYDVGDVIVWSNGRVETVVQMTGDKLFWRVNNGGRVTADRNFILPPTSWHGGDGSGEAHADVDHDSAWLMGSKDALDFQVSRLSANGRGSLESWTCKAGEYRRIKVPVGVFETIPIVCRRTGAPIGEWVQRTWYYAPKVRHFVQRDDRLPNDRIESIRLIAISPGGSGWPPAARAGLDWSIQDALNRLADGESSEWRSTGVASGFQILPTATGGTGNGAACRIYQLNSLDAGAERMYPALACRLETEETWRIPFVDGNDSADELSSLL